MRILVCGSRTWKDAQKIYDALNKACNGRLDAVEVVIDGAAAGADTIGHLVAKSLGFKTERYPADWSKYGKRAGYVRNRQMLQEGRPDLVLAFWDGLSRGTRNMIELATKAGITVEIVL